MKTPNHHEHELLSALVMLLSLLLFPTVQAAVEPGQEVALEVPDCQYPCRFYLPTDYKKGKRLPLIIFMHGSGAKPTTWPWKSATNGKGYLILGLSYGVFPDGGQGRSGIRADAQSRKSMVEFIEKARKMVDEKYGIDQKKVFLSGLSMGGWGVNFYGFLPAAAGRYRGYCIMAAGTVANPKPDLSVTKGLPVMLINGETDANLSAANRGKPLLEKAGARLTQVIIPGQGHVPATNTLAPPLGKWLATIAARDTREQGLAAIAWQDGALKGKQILKGNKQAAILAYLGEQEFCSKANKSRPTLIYCTVQGDTKEAARCVKADQQAFSYPGACTTPAAARQFNCCKIDLTGLDRKNHPLIYQRQAPLVILVDRKWEAITLLKGGAIRDRDLSRKMTSLLSEKEQAMVEKRVKIIQPILKTMSRLKKKLDRLRGLIDRRGSSPKRAREMTALEKEYDQLRQKLGAR